MNVFKLIVFSWFFLVILFTYYYQNRNFTFPNRQLFSSTRRRLEHLCETPRVVGSKEEHETMEYIVNEINFMMKQSHTEGLRLNLTVETISGDFFYKPRKGIIRYEDLKNIVFSIRPKKLKRGSVLISSHYDSGVEAIGCYDDGIPVSLMLDMVNAVLQGKVFDKKNPLRHELIFFFNTAEETWLLGSSDYAKSYHEKEQTKKKRAKKNPVIFLNLEAGGVGGIDIISRTNDYFVMKEFSKVIRYPESSIIFKDVFQLGMKVGTLPVTDVLAYHFYGDFKGVELLFFENQQQYHTMEDSYEFVNERSFFHMGENILAFVKHFGSYRSHFPSENESEKSKVDDEYDVDHRIFPFSIVLFNRLIVLRFSSIRLVWIIILVLLLINYGSGLLTPSSRIGFIGRLNQKLNHLIIIFLVLLFLFVSYLLLTIFITFSLNLVTPMFYYPIPKNSGILIFFMISFFSFFTIVDYFFVLPYPKTSKNIIKHANLTSSEYIEGLTILYFIMNVICIMRNVSSVFLPFINLICLILSQTILKDFKVILQKQSTVKKVERLLNRRWWILFVFCFINSAFPCYFMMKEIYILSDVFFSMSERNATQRFYTVLMTTGISSLFFLIFLPVLPYLEFFKLKKPSSRKLEFGMFLSVGVSMLLALALYLILIVPIPYSMERKKGIFMQQVLVPDVQDGSYITFQSKGFIDPLVYLNLEREDEEEYSKTKEIAMEYIFSHIVPKKGKSVYQKKIYPEDEELEYPRIDIEMTTKEEDLDDGMKNITFFLRNGTKELFFQNIEFEIDFERFEFVDWSLFQGEEEREKIWKFILEEKGVIHFYQIFGWKEVKECEFWILLRVKKGVDEEFVEDGNVLRVKTYYLGEKFWGEDYRKLVESANELVFPVKSTIVFDQILF